MSAPLTLPTVEELKAAFPQAAPYSTNMWGSFVGLTFGGRAFRLHISDGKYVCRYDDGRGRHGTHPTDWRLCVRDAMEKARARYARQAEEAQAAVAALDEAMGVPKTFGQAVVDELNNMKR